MADFTASLRAGMAGPMIGLRRFFVFAFWAAVMVAYVAAIMPAQEAPHVATWDKLNHMIAFFTITFLARAAYPRMAILPLFVLLAGFGALIELSQAIPFIHRDAEWNDWFADIAATCAGLFAAWPFAIVARRMEDGRRSAPQNDTKPLD